MEPIDELESYTLYQEINDTFLLIAQMISSDERGLTIKDTFLITLKDELILKENKSSDDANIIIKWLINKKKELLQMINDCIKLTTDNFARFKSENPKIKEEVITRTKELKKSIKFLNELNLQELTYEDIKKLKSGPVLNSDYAGIQVSEIKNYLI